jgi:hypothetical protein
MSFVHAIVNDLREKRLWPVAAALLAAIVAVPILLSKPASKQPPYVPPVPVQVGASQTARVPVITVEAATAPNALTGISKRDPFTQQKLAPPTTSSTSSAAASTTTTSPAAAAGSSSSSVSGPTTVAAAPTTPSPAPTAPVATTTPAQSTQPAPTPSPSSTPTHPVAGLKSTEAYHVTVAISNASGGFDTIDPVRRLSPLPSRSEPLLIELGVLQGGRHVLFAVQPGTAVSGPGSCTPGPVDCQILSLAPNQTEHVSAPSSAGASVTVTAITKDGYPSVAAATAARRAVATAGQDLLRRSTLDALPLFQYQPGVGAVVDLRNLTVGGN